jgi:hypothetical protein
VAAHQLSRDKVTEIRKLLKQGLTPFEVSRRCDIAVVSVRHVAADPNFVGTDVKTANEVLQEIAALEAQLPPAVVKKAPARVVKAVEAAEKEAGMTLDEAKVLVGSGVRATTLNPAYPQRARFVFNTTHRPPNADAHPERSEPTPRHTASGTHFNLFTGRPHD